MIPQTTSKAPDLALRFRIAIADDDQDLRELIALKLSAAGYDVEEASDGRQLLEEIQHNRPDLIISDLQMPGLSGLEVLERLRLLGSAIPFILITGLRQANTQEQLDRLGLACCLNKPLDMTQLLSTVERITRRFAPVAAGPSGAPQEVGERSVVWIVDDSPVEAAMTEKALGSMFATRVFADGASVLEQIVISPAPDVLLLDWMMPGVSGIDVCKFLRANEATSNLPILLLTSNNQTQHLVEGFGAGANDFLIKPCSSEELFVRVTSLIRSKRLRERAEKAERSMRTLLGHLPDGLITANATGEVTFLNAEAERILSCQTKTAKGRHLGSFFPALENVTRSKLVEGAFEALPELRVGASLYAPAVGQMELDGVPTIAVTLRDVTEKRRLESRRLDFYSMVAHDLRTPLSAMQLRVGRIKEEIHGPLADGYRSEVNAVNSRIGELVAMVNDFLDIARSEGVGFTLAPEFIDLESLVRSHLADFEEIARLREVTRHFEQPKAVVEVYADPARLKQAITNLVSNAVKFSPKGGRVFVEIARHGLEVEVAVRDEGRGVSEDLIPELFKRYSRPAADTSIPGTGLGLMIVREIVAAHAGTCGVTSGVGTGSRFWFRIPDAPGHASARFAGQAPVSV